MGLNLLSSHARLVVASLLITIALALTAACGGGDDDNGEAEPTATPSDTTEPAGDEPTPGDGEDGPPEAASYTIDQEFWHSGFHVTMHDGTVESTEPDIFGEFTVFTSINATFENLGDENTQMFLQMQIIGENGGAVSTLSGESDVPSVPAGGTADGTIVFIVEEDFDPDSSYILVGSGEENKARVPLGPQGGEAITLEPSSQPISGTITMELLDLTFTSVDITADNPGNTYFALEEGTRALVLNFDVTSRKQGNWSILDQDFALTGPDGNTSGVFRSDIPSLDGTDDGIDTTGLWVAFLVGEDPAGDYTLRFTPGSWFVGEDGVDEATFEFSLT